MASDASSALPEIIKGMPDDVAMAREYAVLGAYDVSLAYYDRAVGSAARALRAVVDTQDRHKWTKVRKSVGNNDSIDVLSIGVSIGL